MVIDGSILCNFLDKTVDFAFSTDRRDSIGSAFAICIHVDGTVDTSDGMQEMAAFEVNARGRYYYDVHKILEGSSFSALSSSK